MDNTMKILIAYDASPCSDAALEDLRRAGLPRQAEALVLSVADLPLAITAPTFVAGGDYFAAVNGSASMAACAADPVEEVHRWAEHARQRIQAEFPAWDVAAEAHAGLPDRVIVDRAKEWQPHLLVLGSHGRSSLGRFMLGSVSLKVLSRTRCSVRIARGITRGEMSRLGLSYPWSAADASPPRILVGVDGSPGADAAVRAVAQRTWPAGSEFRVLSIIDSSLVVALNPLMPHASVVGPDAEPDARRIAGHAVDTLRAAGLSAAALIRRGDPKHAVVDESIGWGAGCIFVGARGLGRLERFLLGSVSTCVAARAHCTVEIVRPACQCSEVPGKQEAEAHA